MEKWNAPLRLNDPSLELYLNEPLLSEEKIPISSKQMKMLLLPNPSLPEHFCGPEDLEVLFTENEDETADFIWLPLFSAILSHPPNSSGTEESFIGFWDRNIIEILRAHLSGFATATRGRILDLSRLILASSCG